jgi:hypothetical protein
MGSKGKAPAPPDFAAAAREQGSANLDAAIATGVLNRPNEVTPLGSRLWNQTGTYQVGDRAVPIFTATTQFTPQGRRLYDTNIATQQALGDLGLTGATKAGQILGQRFEIRTIPGIDKTADYDRESVYRGLVGRAEDQYARDRDEVRSRLVAQGIPPGSEAYSREMERLDRGLNDARQQAHLGAGQAQQQQMDARRQMITEALLNRQTPLQEINALRSGSQVQQPIFQPYASAGPVQAAPIFGAAAAQGNYALQAHQADVQADNGLISGLGQIGAAAASRPWSTPARNPANGWYYSEGPGFN